MFWNIEKWFVDKLLGFKKLQNFISPIYYKIKKFFVGNEKIFGIGLGRTGTLSLTYALMELGYKTRHYPPVPEFFKIIDKYDALTDIPIAYYFKILDKLYPNSKFILTIRDMESWLKSCKHHIKITHMSKPWQFEIRAKFYGTIDWDRDKFIETYIDHQYEVLQYFIERPNDLLIIDVINGDGYEKLCPFLGKTILNKSFPHKNIKIRK